MLFCGTLPLEHSRYCLLLRKIYGKEDTSLPRIALGMIVSLMIIRLLLFLSLRTKLKLIFILWEGILGEGYKNSHIVAPFVDREFL
jgi:hypothetical protein